MYCRTCGNKINDNAEICVKCGCKPLIGKKYCQNCGATTTSQQVMCIKCKTTLKPIVFNNNQNQMSKAKRIFGKILTILGIILLAYITLCTAVYLFTQAFIFELIYEPDFFFERVEATILIVLISIILLFIGKRLSKNNRKV